MVDDAQKEVLFENNAPGVPCDLPLPEILKLQASLARVLHLSGAAEYVWKVIDEAETLKLARHLSNDGSTDIRSLFLAKGLVECGLRPLMGTVHPA